MSETTPITFDEQKRRTAEDCDALSEMIKEVGASARQGNVDAFERFFIEGGTHEGDAKINELLDRLCLRYVVRKKMVK